MDLARAPRRTARKKGSGYENACETASDKLVPSLQFVPDSSTVPRYILVRENMPVRGLGVDIYNAGDWGRVRVCSKIGSGFFSISSEISVNLSKIPTIGPLRKKCQFKSRPMGPPD